MESKLQAPDQSGVAALDLGSHLSWDSDDKKLFQWKGLRFSNCTNYRCELPTAEKDYPYTA